MTIEVDNRHRPVGLINTPQQGQGDRVITTESDDTGKSLPSARQTEFISVGIRLAHQDAVVSFLDLLDSPGVIVSVPLCDGQLRTFFFKTLAALSSGFCLRSNRDIATIQNSHVANERIRL
jgi:hypothetical protein